MVDPLAGWHSYITTDNLKRLALAGRAGAPAVEAAIAEIARQAGVSATAVIRGVWLAQGSSAPSTWLGPAIAAIHEIPSAALSQLVTAAYGESAAATAAAASAGVGGSALAAEAAATTGATAAAGTGISLLGGIGLALAAGALALGLSGLAGRLSADDPITPVVPQSDGSGVVGEIPEAVSGESFGGFAVVQVENHPGHAVAVMELDVVERVTRGDQNLYLCNFLHGGNCSSHCVITPSQNEVCGEDIPARLRVINEFRQDTTPEGAWGSLCGSLSEVGPAGLAEGFVGKYGSEIVTIDWQNWIFANSPCGSTG